MYADEAELARLFSAMPDMLPVYHALEDRINETCGDVDVRVQRTQVTFTDRFGFAWASLPVRRRRVPTLQSALERDGDVAVGGHGVSRGMEAAGEPE